MGKIEKQGGHGDTEGVAHRADDEGLHQNHADDASVGDADRLQRAELFQVLHRE